MLFNIRMHIINMIQARTRTPTRRTNILIVAVVGAGARSVRFPSTIAHACSALHWRPKPTAVPHFPHSQRTARRGV